MSPARAAFVVAVCVSAAGATALSARSAVHPTVTRRQAVNRLGGLLGGKPEHVRLVFADERTTDVALEWTAYAPHAKVRIIGCPIGRAHCPRYAVGPAAAWVAASGSGYAGVLSSGRRRRTHNYAVPNRSYSISVARVRQLWDENLRIRLTPLRIHPTISRKRALALLRSRHLQPQRIWLVVDRWRLSWLAAVQRGRYALLDARSGKLVRLTGADTGG